MSQTNPRRTVEPSVEPITLAEAKEWAKIDGTAEDSKITALIKAARQQVEQYLNRTLITTTWAYRKDSFPTALSSIESVEGGLLSGYNSEYEAEAKFYGVQPSDIVLPMGNVQSVTSVKYIDRDGNEQTVAADTYFLARGQYITPETSKQWPGIGTMRNRDGVEIVYVAGFGDTAADVPDDIKTAIKMLVAEMYDQQTCSCGMSKAAAHILSPYYVKRLPKARTRTLERA